jgi:phosphohistidine phosphatase
MTAKTLVVLRHAKAETPGAKPDFERELSKRGRTDADAAGSWLADEGLYPGLVICSPATRTRQTWHGVAVALDQAAPDHASPEVRYDPGLYDGGRTEVIDALRRVPEDVQTVLVVGHNPTMSDVSLLLASDQDHDPQWEGLKTAGLAVHRTDAAWSDTEPGSFPLVKIHTARG